jgi:hypothetical protein
MHFFVDSLLLVTQIIKGKQLYYKMCNVSYRNCCKKNIYVNDSQNLPFPTSHSVIELLPFDYLSNQKQWVNKKMHFKRNNSPCEDLPTLQFWSKSHYPFWSYCPFFIKMFSILILSSYISKTIRDKAVSQQKNAFQEE